MAGAFLAALLVVPAPCASAPASQAAVRPQERRAPPAPPAAGPDLGAQFLGEGGGYRAPDGAAGDYLEHADRPIGPTSPLPATPNALPNGRRDQAATAARPATPNALPNGRRDHAAPAARPATPDLRPEGRRDQAATAARPSPPNARPEGRREPAAAAARPAAKTGRGEERRESLWQGLTQPLELPPGDAGERRLDEAEGAARRDYESRVLGARVTRDLSTPAPEPPPPSLPDGAGMLFASVSLKEGPEVPGLRDAVAALSATVAFRPHPGPAAPGSLRGWLPAAGLGELLRIPWVSRVEVSPGPGRAAASAGASSRVLVGIRLREGEPRDQALARVLGELRAHAGFEWRRSVGVETLPGSGERALVVLGEVPVRRLARVLAHPDVLKIVPESSSFSDGDSAAGRPAPGIVAAARARLEGGAERGGPARSAQAMRFLDFVLNKAPLLLLLTALALIPAAGDWLIAFLKFFIPYR